MKNSNNQCSGALLIASLSKASFNPLPPSSGWGFLGRGSNDWQRGERQTTSHLPSASAPLWSITFNCLNQEKLRQGNQMKKGKEYFCSNFNRWSSWQGPEKGHCLQRQWWDTLVSAGKTHLKSCVTSQNDVYTFTQTIQTHRVTSRVSQLWISMLPACYAQATRCSEQAEDIHLFL